MRAAVVMTVMAAASPAMAWEAFLQSTSEVSLRGSSESSTSTSRAERRAEREAENEAERQRRMQQARRGPAGAQCRADADCIGWCRDFVCADRLAPAPQQQPVPAQPAPVNQGCSTWEQCGPAQSCVDGACVSPPPPPPPSVRRRATEVFLRERVAQLREDTALGRGAVIDELAAFEGVPPRELGATMRAHRGALLPMVEREPEWMGRFMELTFALHRARAAVASVP